MNIINDMVQGSDAWIELRAKRHTASEAAAIFGDHKYMSREELLKQKTTGSTKEISSAQQVIFDRGHAAEAAARPIAERIIGEELFPCTVEDDEGRLLASMDGLTMLGDVGWECKLFNKSLAERVGNDDLEEHYKWQMDQQMLVSGADRILFMCTDGTEENTVWCWYERDESRFSKLVAGWDQFDIDLANYTPIVEDQKPEADPIEAFPALSVSLVGEVKSTNLPVFKSKAIAYIESISTDLQTDEDFANAEAAVKFCDNAEKEIEVVKSQALSQTSTIDELFRTMDQIKESLRQKRLTLNKLVKERKESLKAEIITEARQTLIGEIAKANEEFSPVVINGVTADFPAAAKNKRTFSSLRSSVNDELTRARLKLSERRDHVRSSISIIGGVGKEYSFLFSDIQQLVDKEHDHLQLIVNQRVEEHKAEQQRKIDEEAERKAQEIARKEREDRERQEREAQAKADKEAQDEREMADSKPAPAQQENVVSMPSKPAEEGAAPVVTKPHVKLQSAGGTSRPSDDDIIEALANHYKVNEFKVIGWLQGMNLEAAGRRIAQNA